MNGVCSSVKIDKLLILLAFAVFSLCLLVFSGSGSSGAIHGLKLSYSVIIPSLFPFTVCALIIYDCIFTSKFKNRPINRLQEIIIYSVSLIGGFPVGAKLIEKSYLNKSISKKNAEFMLAFCVNSGPAFIIIAIGNNILSDIKLGYILFSANILSTLVLFLIYYFKTAKDVCNNQSLAPKSFADSFVSSTYDATQSIMLVCAFVVLFSSVISVLNELPFSPSIRNTLVSLLEITNSITTMDNNIYFIAFLLGFSGFCVHFQVLSMCRALKPNYLLFLSFRIVHGLLNILFTKIIVRLFNINVDTISNGKELSLIFSQYSIHFGILFVLLSVAFMFSVNKENNI